ncbi:hypothetical protein M1V89_28150, partial [Klebsiella pneumoniae]|nr:hypothetical protein [Klebsiella pneumoniae]
LTGINKSTMSKVFRSLKEKRCLIENNENTYLNSVIFMKGLPQKLFMQYRDHFLKSIDYKLSDKENFEEVFDDKFIELYEKNLQAIKDKRKELKEMKKKKAEEKFENKLNEEVKKIEENKVEENQLSLNAMEWVDIE